MTLATTAAVSPEVRLRPVSDPDIELFFDHQADPVASLMAAFPVQSRPELFDYWAWLRSNKGVIARTILADGQVAGSIVCFGPPDEREVGYWLGRAFWGRGIATRALRAFLSIVPERPLHARAAQTNAASRRVLEKCGFAIVAEAMGPSHVPGEDVPDYVFRLEANATNGLGG